MSRLVVAAVFTILLLSAVVTALTSSVLSAGSAPDERHHYSYVKHVAENPLQFPPRFDQIRTDRGDPNHLVHPPLYYQLMAIPYRLLDVDRQLTAVGRELDAHGFVSRASAIPALRTASLLLAVLHLVGLYYLLCFLVVWGVLPGWGAVVAAACLALVPGFTYIAATLNNDVLALALWPFLVLTTLRFVRDGRRIDAYWTVALVAAAVLTKATLWVLALVCAITVAGRVLRAVLVRGADASSAPKYVWAQLAPRSTAEKAWLAVAGVAALAAITVLTANLARHGALHPSYHRVFGLAIEDSKFYRVPPGGALAKSPGEMVMWAATLLAQSLFGILGHTERFFSPHPERLAQVVMALTALAVVLVAWRLSRGFGIADRVGAGLMLTAGGFLSLYFVRVYGSYHRSGHFAAQGRYLIAYADLWVLGLLILVGRAVQCAQRRWSRAAAAFLAVAVVAALGALFVRPLHYLSRTTELHARMQVERLLRGEAENEGMKRIDLRAVAPEQFVAGGVRQERGPLPRPRFLMAWQGSRLEAPLTVDGQGCVAIWVHGIGEHVWGEPTKLAIGLRPRSAALADVDGGVMIELPERPEVARVVLPRGEPGEAMLTVTVLNVTAPAPWPGVEKVWPRTRIPQVFAVYAGAAKCR